MNKIVFAKMAARPDGGAEEQKTGALTFSRVMAAEEKVGVVTLTGYVGYGNATVDEFNKSLESLKAEGCTKMDIVINSPGGYLFEASGIFDLIRGSGMDSTAKIYGVSASAATYIACACNRVFISENSRYMVHRAQGGVCGNVDEIESYLKDLKGTENQILKIYAARTGKSVEEVMEVLKAETWMNAETAVSEGWCDEVISVAAPETEKAAGGASNNEDQPAKTPDKEEEKENGAPQNTVVRRMMAAVGITTASTVEDLEREVARLVKQNETLAAQVDGFRGVEAERARIMAAHEKEFQNRVQVAVVKEMASMGVLPASLPPASAEQEEGQQTPPKMTNEQLEKMDAKEAVAWLLGHPLEAARLAENP